MLAFVNGGLTVMFEKMFFAERTETTRNNRIERLCVVATLHNSGIRHIDMSFSRGHRYKPYTTLDNKKELPLARQSGITEAIQGL